MAPQTEAAPQLKHLFTAPTSTPHSPFVRCLAITVTASPFWLGQVPRRSLRGLPKVGRRYMIGVLARPVAGREWVSWRRKMAVILAG